MGPDKLGRFFPIEIEEIQCNRVQVNNLSILRLNLYSVAKFVQLDLNKEI